MPVSDSTVADSLQGRWIRLARSWVLENVPCSVSDYYAAVVPMMPNHIRCSGGKQRTQIALARDALSRLDVVIENNSIVSARARKPYGKGYCREIMRRAELQDCVTIDEFRHYKNAWNYFRWLCKTGQLEQIGKGIYRLPRPGSGQP